MRIALAAVAVISSAGCDVVWHLQRGDDVARDAAVDAAVSANLAFVTSVQRAPASLGGLAAADALCTTLAHDAGHDGTYVAWLSGSSTTARTRLAAMSPRGWVRPDGKPFADTIDDLIFGRTHYPLRLTETGDDVTATGNDTDVVVATGSLADGTTAVGRTCNDYTFAGGDVTGGNADMSPFGWDAATEITCTTPARLYCFGIDRSTAVTVVPESSRRAFLAGTDLGPGAGIASFDDACATDARAAGLPGTFHVALASVAASALSRFAPGTPWVRADGTTVIDTDGNLIAPISSSAAGFEDPGESVWSGALALRDPAPGLASSCHDWAVYDATQGRFGQDSRSGGWAFGHDTVACTYGLRVYCLQD